MSYLISFFIDSHILYVFAIVFNFCEGAFGVPVLVTTHKSLIKQFIQVSGNGIFKKSRLLKLMNYYVAFTVELVHNLFS